MSVSEGNSQVKLIDFWIDWLRKLINERFWKAFTDNFKFLIRNLQLPSYIDHYRTNGSIAMCVFSTNFNEMALWISTKWYPFKFGAIDNKSINILSLCFQFKLEAPSFLSSSQGLYDCIQFVSSLFFECSRIKRLLRSVSVEHKKPIFAKNQAEPWLNNKANKTAQSMSSASNLITLIKMLWLFTQLIKFV